MSWNNLHSTVLCHQWCSHASLLNTHAHMHAHTHTHTHSLLRHFHLILSQWLSLSLEELCKYPMSSTQSSPTSGCSKWEKQLVVAQNGLYVGQANSFLAGTDEMPIFPHPRVSFPEKIWTRYSYIWASAVKSQDWQRQTNGLLYAKMNLGCVYHQIADMALLMVFHRLLQVSKWMTNYSKTWRIPL